MAGRLVEFAGWLATQVFDVVGTVAGVAGADGGATVDLQVGKTVFHDVPAKMRTELWLSQLHRKSAGGGAPPSGEYYDLLFEELSPDVLAEIDKDTHRTFPGHTWLSSPAGQKAMLNVLRAYALTDPEIGYTQGMNFLAGLLLTYLPSEADAYAALSLLMHQRGLREMYLPDMSLLQIRLWQLSKLLPPRLAAHLEAHAALPVLYASSWLLTCFAADFPLHFAARVVDVLMTGQAAASLMLKVAVGIVSRCEAPLLAMDDFEQMVNHLRQEVPQWPKRDLQDLLTDALSKPWSTRQLRVLDQINGAETVMEAVARVNGLAGQASESAEAVASGGLESSASSPTPPAEGSPQAAAAGEPPAQLTPRAVARTLSTSFRLPKPPAGPPGHAAPAAWASWKSAGSDLDALPPQKVRIDRSVAADLDLVQLDPQLSRALSAYSPHQNVSREGSVASAAQAAPPAPLQRQRQQGHQGQPHQQQQQQQQQQQPQQQQQGQGSPAGRQAPAKWDAFAQASSVQLQAAPSPFAEGARPPRQQQQPGAPQAAMPQSPRGAAADAGSESAPSYGSFQMNTAASAVPLVDVGEQREPAAAAGDAGDGGAQQSKALTSFLSLFAGSSKGASSQGSPSPAPSGSANLIREAPSSHGSSLAAVLHALNLNANWASSVYDTASSAGGAPDGAAAGDRRLRHGREGEEWSSFKTAADSDQGLQGHNSDSLGLSSVSSWQSTAQYARRASGLSSDGSGPALPLAAQLGGRPPAGRTPMRQLSAVPASAEERGRLSGEAATRRVASLQEEHLQSFRSTAGGKDGA